MSAKFWLKSTFYFTAIVGGGYGIMKITVPSPDEFTKTLERQGVHLARGQVNDEKARIQKTLEVKTLAIDR